MQATEVTPATRFADLCSDTLAFAVQLRRAKEPSAEAVRADVKRLFAELDRAAQAANKDPVTTQTVRYALVAFLDELVLSSNWSIRGEWASDPLQMQYFNDFTAGEEFYRKLDSLRGAGEGARREALEVYLLVLGLGFRGKYAGLAGMEELRTLRSRLHAELGGSPQPQYLSPHAAAEEQLPQIVRRIPAWVFAASVAGALFLLVLVLRFLLGGVEDGLAGGS